MSSPAPKKFRPLRFVVALAFVGVVYGYFVYPAVREIWPAMQRSRAETFRSRQRIQRMTLEPRAQPQIWTFTPEGPELLGGYGLSRDLSPEQRQIVNAILKITYREYLQLEAEHSAQQQTDSGHRVTSIEPFAAQFEELQGRFWSKLDQIFDEQQQVRARAELPTRPNGSPALFGWGGEAAEIEIWQEGETFHWSVDVAGQSRTRSGPALPAELARFW